MYMYDCLSWMENEPDSLNAMMTLKTESLSEGRGAKWQRLVEHQTHTHTTNTNTITETTPNEDWMHSSGRLT